MTHRKQQN